MRQAHAVNALGPADIGRAEAGNRNGFIGRQAAGHARHPEHFVAVFLQRLVGELVQLCELFKRGFGAGMGAGDQFDLRLAEVGGDAGMRQGRTQGGRMRRQRQRAAGLRPQAFFFKAPAHALELLGCQRLQALLQNCVGMGLQGGHTVFSRILGIGVEVITHRCFALSQVVCLYGQRACRFGRWQDAENKASIGLAKPADLHAAQKEVA